MGCHRVDLPKTVSGESLEEACIKAANELGYKAKPQDEFSRRYELGSIHQHDDYDRTNIRVGNLLPALQVREVKKGEQQKYFFVWTGFPHGFASEKRIQEYLSAVSKYL